MSSLQKPRKITVRGSDGRSYGFLCKPKDDLRKDARLMEFNSMIIKLLKKDSDARSRKLSERRPLPDVPSTSQSESLSPQTSERTRSYRSTKSVASSSGFRMSSSCVAFSTSVTPR